MCICIYSFPVIAQKTKKINNAASFFFTDTVNIATYITKNAVVYVRPIYLKNSLNLITLGKNIMFLCIWGVSSELSDKHSLSAF